MIIDERLMRAELSRDESREHKAYRDTLGNWTIGVGHKLPLWTKHPERLVWTDTQIDHWLDQDIQAALQTNLPLFWFKTLNTDPRRRALVNMRFNLGRHLDGFHSFLHYLSQAEWQAASDDLTHTLWEKQVGARAWRIQEQIVHG